MPDKPTLLHRLVPDRIVLTFHGIGTPRRPLDPGEEPFWVNEQAFADAVAAAAENSKVEITFDDGNASDAEIALPILKQARMTATFFVLAGRLGEAGSLHPRDVATLVAEGMTVGSHGADHIDWTRATDETMRRELYDARARIEDAAGVAVDALSIPFGAFDKRTLERAAAAGYSSVHTSTGGVAAHDAWFVPRNTVRRDLQANTLIDRLDRWSARIDATLKAPLRAWKYGIRA